MPWCVLLVARGPDADRRTTADGDAVRTTLAINPRRSPLRELGAALRAADRRTREEIRSTLVRTSHPRDGSVREERIVWRALRQVADRVDGRLTRAGVLRRGHRDRLPPLLSPSRVELANAVLRWASETIGAPHPELGRKGPICPFVSKTIMVDRLFVAIHDEIDGARPGPLRAVILAHAARLKRELPATDPEGAFNSLVLVFPSIPPERQSVLDRVHDELKAHLMKRDVMSAAFHERSEKPAHHNPAFRAYRAPFACWVLRHMDVRDILFLGHNQEAFERYRQVYAERFERGLVSNEFGYVDLFHQALERFEK
jgi:hypothetical protein